MDLWLSFYCFVTSACARRPGAAASVELRRRERRTLLAGAAGELAGATRARLARPSSACTFSASTVGYLSFGPMAQCVVHAATKNLIFFRWFQNLGTPRYVSFVQLLAARESLCVAHVTHWSCFYEFCKLGVRNLPILLIPHVFYIWHGSKACAKRTGAAASMARRRRERLARAT